MKIFWSFLVLAAALTLGCFLFAQSADSRQLKDRVIYHIVAQDKEGALKVKERIDAGEKFIDILNKEYLCRCHASEKISGNLNEGIGSNEKFVKKKRVNGFWVTLMPYDPAFVKLMGSLPYGISGPIQSSYGWHIFNVLKPQE